VATPEASVPVPSVVPPSRNVTVPLGAAALPAAPVMVAVSVTLEPAVMVVADVVSAAVVAYFGTTGAEPYRFSNTVDPTITSGLPSLFMSSETACPLPPTRQGPSE
jgi:hypothetical protein